MTLVPNTKRTKLQIQVILLGILGALLCWFNIFGSLTPGEVQQSSKRFLPIGKSDNEDKKARCTNAEAELECLNVLGRNGTWVQDWDFAQRYGQYKLPRAVGMGPFVKRTRGKFKPSADAPFPWETSWKWVDHNSINQDTCQVDYTMDADKMCSVLGQLGVDRIFFLGDSLSESQYTSFLNSMGRDRLVNYTDHVKETPRINSRECTLLCKDKGFSVRTKSTKVGGGYPFAHSKIRINMTLSSKSREFLTSSPQRMLAILNIGAHYHEIKHFEEDLDTLFGWFDEFERPDDLIFFRSTPSGHKNCVPQIPRQFNFTSGIRTKPLQAYSNFKPDKTFDWNKFESYNMHTRNKLVDRRRERETRLSTNISAAADIRFLDVYNMTVLRHDGHTGGRDCLHYVEPGPIDWWNHLLYSHLQAIAAVEKSASATSSCRGGSIESDG
jgi:hypothetical protein